ncbi:MAG: cytochrome c biogenesis protein CcdA [Bradyrhizobium sp.]|nr:cytochrome c biogenesis protein CcdA [Bradyrhizobium sp.]
MTLGYQLGAALAAGLLSFLSPCILPLVPPFLCYMAGVSAAETVIEAAPVPRRRTVLTALCFVAGFSLVFVGLGATASVFGRFIAGHLSQLGLVAGLVIIMMGLHFLGLLRIPLLYRSATIDVGRKPAGLLGAFVMGLAFAFGWTPCIGPILAAILSIAAAEATVAKGAGLLAIYSAGLGIPFLVAAFMIEQFSALFMRMRGHLVNVERAMGLLMIVTGIGFLTGAVSTFSIWLLETFPALQKFG